MNFQRPFKSNYAPGISPNGIRIWQPDERTPRIAANSALKLGQFDGRAELDFGHDGREARVVDLLAPLGQQAVQADHLRARQRADPGP